MTEPTLAVADLAVELALGGEMKESAHGVAEVSTVRAAADVLVIALVGEHDLTSAPTVERAITEGLDDGLNLVVDVSETEFLDLSTLHVLIKSQREASARGRRFVLQFGTAAIVQRVFESSGLLERFVIRGSSDDAVSAVRGSEVWP